MIEEVRKAGGRMLYRGAPRGGIRAPLKVKDEPDLLDPNTYGNDGAGAHQCKWTCMRDDCLLSL